MNFRNIECFLAFVEVGTVTGAAEKLHLTQPALSRRLSALEADLGLKLFDHQRNRLQITSAGRELLPLATQFVDYARYIESASQNWSAGYVRQLRIAATPATVTELIAPFIGTLSEEDPLLLTQEARPQQLQILLDSGVDMIVTPSHLDRSLSTMHLGAVLLRAYVSNTHRWALERQTEIDLEELIQESLILHSPQSIGRQVLDLAVASTGMPYFDINECDNALTIQALASKGRGVGVVTNLPTYPGWHVKIRDPFKSSGHYLCLILNAAWKSNHYSAQILEKLAQRLHTFQTSIRPDP